MMINVEDAQDVFKDVGEVVSCITLAFKRENQAKEKALVQAFCSRYEAICHSMMIRYPESQLRVSVGFSKTAYDYLFPNRPLPKELKTFTTLENNNGRMPATKGDILLHIRANKEAVVYEVTRQMMAILKGAVTVIDETKGFRYFEGRAIIGFVDGTEVPVGKEAMQAALIDSSEDETFANGSYLFVQKWRHQMDQWENQSMVEQEKAVGRKKFSDEELEDKDKFPNAHNLASHLEVDGKEKKIIRMNVPYANNACEEIGTQFIGYSCHLTTIEAMLEQMMAENDFLLSFSTILSGQYYFVPAKSLLEKIGDGTW